MHPRIKQLITPTKIEYIWYLMLSIALLLLGHFQVIVDVFTQDDSASSSIQDVLSTETDQFLDLISSYSLSASTVTFAFWLIVGAIIYIVAISVSEFFSEGSHIFAEESEFVHPKGYEKGSSFKDFAKRTALHLAVFILFSTYVLIFVQFLWPLWGRMFRDFILNPGDAMSIIMLAISVVGSMICLHLLSVFTRALFLRPRVLKR